MDGESLEESDTACGPCIEACEAVGMLYRNQIVNTFACNIDEKP